ncbi:MAG: hypothetical protein AB7E47_02165 [Desulfovibrionaceae bacterium]
MLLTTAEAAELLRTSPGAARNVLDRLCVRPVNLGRGRGLGLRWYRHEIEEALEQSRTPKAKRKTVPSTPLISGRSVSDVVAELTGGQHRQ